MIELSIIIVNYNVKEFLQNLLKSIQQATKEISHEVIVVDNASDDGSVEVLKEKYPHVKLIENKENVGFGKANNQGMKLARGKYFVLINPDTIVKEDTFEKMMIFFESNAKTGMAGCKVLNPDGSIQLACRRSFPGPWTSFTKITGLSRLFPKSKIFARYNLTYLDENETYKVDAISGAFMMLRREVYETLGGFDPEFFMYGEDLDFCYRTKNSGYDVYYVHSTEIIHYKGESTRRSSIDETKVFYDAMHLFVRKHFSSSFLVEWILQFAIIIRKLFAVTNVYRLAILSVLVDFALFILSMFAAGQLYHSSKWGGFPSDVLPWIYLIPAVIQIIFSSFVGAYKRNSLSILRTIFSLLISFFFISSITYFFKEYAYSRAVLLITYLILFFAYPAWRIIIKIIFKVGVESGTHKQRTLVVGHGTEALILAEKLKSSYTSLHQIVGLISSSRINLDKSYNNYKVIGTLENIRKVIDNEKIDKVIFSSDELSFNQIFSVVSQCQGLNVDFSVSGSEHDFLVGKSSITMLEDIPLLKIHYNISSYSHKLLKNLMDLFISIPVLLLIYPFIYSFAKLSGTKNKLSEFVISMPSVVFGKKSLVGPSTIGNSTNLYLGKEGLTGIWFTEGIDLKDKKEVEKLNIFYARNQSIWLDFEILGKSLTKMIFNSEVK